MPVTIIDSLQRGGSGVSPFPVAKEVDSRLSYLTVADLTARDTIPEWKRLPYMRVHVVSTATDYRLGIDTTIAGQIWTIVNDNISPGTYQLISEKNQPLGYVGLEANSKINPIYIDNIYSNNSFVVADIAARETTTTATGDIVITLADSKIWVKLNNNPPATTPADYAELTFPGSVLSVNGQTGVVSITIANLLAVPANQTAFDAAVDANSTLVALSGAVAGNTAQIIINTADIAALQATVGLSLIPTYNPAATYITNQTTKILETSGRYGLYVANNSVPVSTPPPAAEWDRIGDYYTVTETDALLVNKADLVSGLVPLVQLPPEVKLMSYVVSNLTARNAITPQTQGMRVYVTGNGVAYIYSPSTPGADPQGFISEFDAGAGGVVTNASNGLYVDVSTVKLGGALVENTSIDTTGYTLDIGTSVFGINLTTVSSPGNGAIAAQYWQLTFANGISAGAGGNMIFNDQRTAKTGIEYDATTATGAGFSTNSLISKAYADATYLTAGAADFWKVLGTTQLTGGVIIDQNGQTLAFNNTTSGASANITMFGSQTAGNGVNAQLQLQGTASGANLTFQVFRGATNPVRINSSAAMDLFTNGVQSFTLSGGATAVAQLFGSLTIGTTNGALVVQRSSGSNNLLLDLRKSSTTLSVDQEGKTLYTFSNARSIANSTGVVDLAGAITLSSLISSSTHYITNITSTINTAGNSTNTVIGYGMRFIFDATSNAINLIGYDYNPAITATPTTEIAYRAVRGSILFGATTPTAATRLDVRGIASGNILVLKDNTGASTRLIVDDIGNSIWSVAPPTNATDGVAFNVNNNGYRRPIGIRNDNAGGNAISVFKLQNNSGTAQTNGFDISLTSSGYTGTIYGVTAASSGHIWNFQNGGLYFGTDNTLRMSIDGTTGATAITAVTSNIAFSVINTAGAQRMGISTQNASTATGASTIFKLFNSAGITVNHGVSIAYTSTGYTGTDYGSPTVGINSLAIWNHGSGMIRFGTNNATVGEFSSAGQFILTASTTARASLNLPHGVAPSSPVNGDLWTTTTSAFVRINGVTQDLLAGGGGGWNVTGGTTLTGAVDVQAFTGVLSQIRTDAVTNSSFWLSDVDLNTFAAGEGNWVGVFAGPGVKGTSLNSYNITTGDQVRIIVGLSGYGGIQVLDTRASATGIEYSGDYRSTLSNRSLTPKDYVLGAKTFTGQQTFAAGATGSLVLGSHTADLSSPANGMMYYNSTANELRARINGAWVALGAGGGGGWATSGNTTITANTSQTGAFTNSFLMDGILITQNAKTSGSPVVLTVTGGTHTNLTASTALTDVYFNLARTVQFATGAITNQNAVLINSPTYSFVGSSTITNAATITINGLPIAGTNATITNSIGLLITGGALTGTITTSYGLSVTAATGATTNLAAQFLGGIGIQIGVATSQPTAPPASGTYIWSPSTNRVGFTHSIQLGTTSYGDGSATFREIIALSNSTNTHIRLVPSAAGGTFSLNYFAATSINSQAVLTAGGNPGVQIVKNTNNPDLAMFRGADGIAGSTFGNDALIQGGTALNTGNTDGGHAFIAGGNKNGTGKDGNVGIGFNRLDWLGVLNFQSMERGLFIRDAVLAPTGNPTTGAFMWVDPTNDSMPKMRTPTGEIHNLQAVEEFNITLDGGGAVLSVGNTNTYKTVGFAGKIIAWYITGDPSGSIVVDVWNNASAIPTNTDTIAGSEKPTLSSQTRNSDVALSTWTQAFAAGSTFGIEIESVTTITKAILTIKYIRT